MNKYQTITVNTFYIMLGTIGSKLIYVLLLPLYTSWLSADEYGAADTITVYTDILLTIVFLNIADSIFVFPKMTESDEEKRAYFSSGLCFIGCMALLAAVVFAGMTIISSFYQLEGVFFEYKWLILGLLVSRYIQMFVQGFTRSLDKLGVYSMSGILLAGLIAVLSFLLIPQGGISGYIYAIVIAQLATSAFSLYAARADRYLSLRAIKAGPLREMLSYSVPLAPNSLMWWLINGINRPMMEQQLGLFSVGIYAVASRISGVISNIPSIFGIAWSNYILSEYGKEGFEDFFNHYLKMMTAVLLTCCMLLVIFADVLIRVFTTPAYYSAASFVPIIALGLSFSCLSSCVGNVFAAAKKSKYFFYASFWGGVASVTSLLILLPLYGLYGVTASLAISFLIILVARWIFASRYVHISILPFFLLLTGLVVVVYLNTILISSYHKYVFDLLVIAFVFLLLRKDIAKMKRVVLGKSS